MLRQSRLHRRSYARSKLHWNVKPVCAQNACYCLPYSFPTLIRTVHICCTPLESLIQAGWKSPLVSAVISNPSANFYKFSFTRLLADDFAGRPRFTTIGRKPNPQVVAA